ncbi:MAG: hypothetical protein U0Q15_10375 [Kineosporiaceae bacterium]
MQEQPADGVRVRLTVGYDLVVDEVVLREHLLAGGLDRGSVEALRALGSAAAMVESLEPAALAATPGVRVVAEERFAAGRDGEDDAATDRGWGPVVRRLVRGLTTWD